MKAIEKKIIRTFTDCINGTDNKSRTVSLSCRDTVRVLKNEVGYELWGHRIFWLDCGMRSFYFSFCGYPTDTTRGRLNALLSHFGCGAVCQRNWDLFWTDGGRTEKVDASRTYRVAASGGCVDIEAVD